MPRKYDPSKPTFMRVTEHRDGSVSLGVVNPKPTRPDEFDWLLHRVMGIPLPEPQ